MIRIGVLFPDHLNLNGDCANADVIRNALKWRGVASELVSVEKGQTILGDLDCLIVGHGSIAAWQDVMPTLEKLTPQIANAVAIGMPLLAVASGYEVLCQRTSAGESGLGLFPLASNPQGRVSKFQVAQFRDSEVLGYLNSESDLPLVTELGSAIGTLLHGPVLAKNPALLNAVLVHIQAHTNSPDFGDLNKNVATEIDGYIEGIWALERDLARE